jgi:hypothetical protein
MVNGGGGSVAGASCFDSEPAAATVALGRKARPAAPASGGEVVSITITRDGLGGELVGEPHVKIALFQK